MVLSLTRRSRLINRLIAFLSLFAIASGAAGTPVGRVSTEGMQDIYANMERFSFGSSKPATVVVIYIDYNCTFCRALSKDLAALIRSGAPLRVVVKDWPIFGEVSEQAARAAAAAAWQGKHQAAYFALMDTPGRLASLAQTRKRLSQAGIDLKRLDQDARTHAREIDEMLARNRGEAAALGLRGTPGVLLGDVLHQGRPSLPELRQFIAAAPAP